MRIKTVERMKEAIDVVMLVYNQAETIARAIESVVKQSVDIPINIIIGDDASTDDSLQICRKYHAQFPELIQLIRHDKNVGLARNYQICLKQGEGRYIAILEGDDFWIRNDKLQMQVDVLRANEQVGLVHTSFFNNISGKWSKYKAPKGIKLAGNIFEDLYRVNYIGPLTVLFRRDIFESHVDLGEMVRLKSKTIDYLLWLEFSRHSLVAYLNDSTAVYEKGTISESRPSVLKKQLKFIETTQNILTHINRKYEIPNDTIVTRQNSLNFQKVIAYYVYGRIQEGNYILTSIKPNVFRHYLVWIYLRIYILFRIKILRKIVLRVC